MSGPAGRRYAALGLPDDLYGRSVFLVCGSTHAADGETACRELGIEPVLTFVRQQLLTSPRRLRHQIVSSGASATVVYSVDWSRQELSQLLLLAMAMAPVGDRRFLIDEAGAGPRHIERLSRSAAAGLPLDVMQGAGAIVREVARDPFGRRLQKARRYPSSARYDRAVIGVWIGAPESQVGGSVTHISGILGGFREHGFKIGLVTAGEVPPQLAAVVDDLEQTVPLAPGARLTSDVERIASNGPVRIAVAQLIDRLRPAFVYQRHRPFLTAPLEVARRAGVPFVLEWNSSEVWVRHNWNKTVGVERVFDPFLAIAERKVVREADVIVSVSEVAAEMAREYGGSTERVLTVPNGVDASRLLALTDGVSIERPPGTRAVIGWIGSFGPWHGAPVLVRALAHLPGDTHLLMIGDGQQLEMCQELARELEVADRVRWTGSLPHDEAVRMLRTCDVLASPHVPLPGQRFFGSPTKIFEYMAIGRPIVASALEQIGEVLEEGVTARLVPPGRDSELAQAIAGVLDSPDRGAALGTAARNGVIAHHTWERRAAAVLGASPLAAVLSMVS
jgi:glycosyltransferase involved in cell wall biosynthesis